MCIRDSNVDEEPIEKESTHIEWDVDAAEKGGYEHFMLKEMYEQPKAITDTFSPRIKGGDIVIEELNMTDEEIQKIDKIMIVACGSAYHAGMTSKYVFEMCIRDRHRIAEETVLKQAETSNSQRVEPKIGRAHV